MIICATWTNEKAKGQLRHGHTDGRSAPGPLLIELLAYSHCLVEAWSTCGLHDEYGGGARVPVASAGCGLARGVGPLCIRPSSISGSSGGWRCVAFASVTIGPDPNLICAGPCPSGLAATRLFGLCCVSLLFFCQGNCYLFGNLSSA